MSAAALLNRLERVRQTGEGRWLACCPAHEDKRPSLSIREVDGGRVLVHDFGGCEVGAVLDAVGLTLADLFDKPLTGMGPAGGYGSSRSRIPAVDLLELISEETSVVGIIAGQLLDNRAITETDWQRLAQAASRIHRARDHIHG